MQYEGGLRVEPLSGERGAVQADSDAVDVALAASGDVHAFERLYRQHLARVHSLARRMVGAEDADEATQDVFVRVWEKLETFRGDSAFGTWLHRVAINVFLALRGKRGRERERMRDGEGVLDRMVSGSSSPEFRVDFEAAVGRLPEGARQVFVLHDVEGFKHHEIAEMLGVTAGTSKAQLHRARMALREYIEL